MSQTLSVAVKPPEGHTVWVACGRCGKVTCHTALTLVATSDGSPGGEIQVWDDYLSIQCGGCRTVSFCVQSSSSEGIEYDPEAGKERLAVTNRVYPNRIAGRSELEHSQLLPYATYRVYQETRIAICNGQPVLAGIGIRAIIETVCKEQSAAGRDLKAKIDDLANKGVVTKDGAMILHSLRFMGNDAAHEVKAHTEEELITALDIAEYTLKGVYILPKIAEKLPKK
jgi:hypothetical protein